MKTKNIVKLLTDYGFSLDDSLLIPYELDPMDNSLDLHKDTYIKDDEIIELEYDEFEILSIEYIDENGKGHIIKNENGLKTILEK